MKMRRVFTTLGDGIDRLKLTEIPMPELRAGEILVKMTAISLNYRDLLVIKGIEHWKPPVPRIPVSDGVGQVIATGENVSRVKPGDRVSGIFLPNWIDGDLTAEKGRLPLGGAANDGVLADYAVFDEKSVVIPPSSLTDVESAALPVAAVTAWHAVAERSRVKSGETVLIQGTGGVSLFALQFVQALGGRAIVTSSNDDKLEKVKKLGAEAAFNYRTFPEWEEQVLKITGGKGVDHVIEVVGGENLNRSLMAVKMSGTISFIGLLAGLSAPINTYQFVGKNVRIHGIETGSRKMFDEMNQFIEQKRIRPVIDKIFEFEQVRDALRYLENGSHFGKLVVRIR